MQQPDTTLAPSPTAAAAVSFNGGASLPRTASDEREARVRLSRSLFLAAAGVSFLFSVSLWFLADRQQGLFVGLWVPSILSLGNLMLGGRGGAR